MSTSESTRTMNVDNSDDESDYDNEHQFSSEIKPDDQERKADAVNIHNENPFDEEYKNADLLRVIAKSCGQHDAGIRFKDRIEYDGKKEDADVKKRCKSLTKVFSSIDGIQDQDAQEVMQHVMKKHRKRVYKKRSDRRLQKGKPENKKKKNLVDTGFQSELKRGLNKPIAFMIGERNDLVDTSDDDSESESELAATFKKTHALCNEVTPRKKKSSPTKSPSSAREAERKRAAIQHAEREQAALLSSGYDNPAFKELTQAWDEGKKEAEEKTPGKPVKIDIKEAGEVYVEAKRLEKNGDIISAVNLYYKSGELGHVEAYADLAYVLNRKENRNIPNPENGHVVYKGQDHVYDNADDAQIRAEYCKEYYEIAAKRGSWHSKYRLKFHPFVSKEDRGKRTLWDDIINAGEAAGEFYYLAVWRKYDNYINYRRISESDKLHAFEMLRSVAPHCDDAMKAVVEWIIPIRMIRGVPGKILDNITNREQVDISVKALIKISRSKKVSQLNGRESKLWWIKVYEHIKMNPWYTTHDQKATIEKLREIVQEINNLMNMRYMKREQREQSLNEMLQRLRDVPVESDP